MKTNEDLARFAEHCADTHRPYIYGTYGLVLTERLLMQKAAQYPERLSQKRVEYAKAHYLGKRTDDCNGLIKNLCWLPGNDFDADPIYNSKQDLSADGAFNAATVKGGISTIPEIRGVCVRYKGHVGVYVGNGVVVEERGFDYGCVRTKLSERKWTDWYEYPFIEYKKEPAPQPTPKGDTCMVELPVLKRGDKNESVRSLQWLLYGLGIKDQYGKDLARDGSFGGKTEYAVKTFQERMHLTNDGIVGKNTWTKLIEG